MGTNYTKDEIAEGFQPTWIKLDDFIMGQEKNEGKIESYGGRFLTRRDLEIAKYYKSLIFLKNN